MTAPARRLHLVDPVDIHAKARAAILERDWASVHVAADKRRPIELPDQRKWGWRR